MTVNISFAYDYAAEDPEFLDMGFKFTKGGGGGGWGGGGGGSICQFCFRNFINFA